MCRRIKAGKPDRLSKASRRPLLAAIISSRSSRGSALTQATLGSTSALLCRLASGGSFAVRQLYTDELFKAARPALLNGIEDIIGRSHLADRAILLTLGPTGEQRRRSETELWREFELARAAILGALLLIELSSSSPARRILRSG